MRLAQNTEVDPRVQPGVWKLDPSHTTVGFVARHLMITKVRGRFGEVDGSITVADDLENSTAEATIRTATIDTRDEGRDQHLRSADFFEVEKYPTIGFRSTSVSHVRDDRWKVDGELSIRDITRPVTLDVEFLGVATDPWGREKIAFSATTKINREDWGLTWNQALETGGVLVSKDIVLEIEAQAVRG